MNISTRFGSLALCWLLGVVLPVSLSTAVAQDNTPRPRGALAVWDTGKPAAEPLTPDAVEQKSGWTALDGTETKAFQGDAVITNGRLLAVARQKGTGVELYALGTGKPVFRARLLPTPAATVERVTLTENSRTAVGLEVASKSGAVRC